MRAFAELYRRLDETTRTGAKVEAMAAYFRAASPADAAWALWFLSGERPRRLVAATKLRQWAAAAAAIPGWLFEECYDAVGDLAETVALLLPAGPGAREPSLATWVEERLLPLRGLADGEVEKRLRAAWSELDDHEQFVFTKLATGAFRVGVSKRLALRALAAASGIDTATLAHRLAGRWRPSAAAFSRLTAADVGDADVSRPYPFFLAHPLTTSPQELGARSDWQAEWKWDGVRAQVVRRGGEAFVWSRGEELVTESFPELAEAARLLPEGTVLDGEILAWRGDSVLPFDRLQRRLGRRRPGAKILARVPVTLLAYDLLEKDGRDQRARPLAERRPALEALIARARLPEGRFRTSPVLAAPTWAELARLRDGARERGTEGLMLKRAASPYGVGRPRGDWWKWKVAPLAIDAVLLYARRGSGRRASLYTDYTFGVWHEGELVPIAKAYSGLTDAEIRRVDRFVRQNTRERFGPVRAVAPELVFELHFDSIRESKRHTSGLALRFPRMARWRHDKSASAADSLAAVRALARAAG